MTKPNKRVYYPFLVKGYICMAVPSHGLGCVACAVTVCDKITCYTFGNVKQFCVSRCGMAIVFKVVRKQPKRSISLRGKSSEKYNE